MENTMVVPQKVELDPANPASRSVSKGFESRISKRHLYTSVCNSVTHNSQKVDAAQVSTDGWVDKHNMVCTCKGILFSLKKEVSSDVCCSMDEAWGHYAKWNKPITKRQILRDPAYMRESQFSSVSQSCPTLCNPMDCSTLGFPVHHQLLEPSQTHVHHVGDAIQPSHPLPSLFPPALNLPNIRVFSNESALCIRWPKYLSFSFSISPSNEYSGLLSFRMDWLDLLAVQETLKSFFQHSSKPSVLRHSGFFIVQLSHPYMTTGKTIALTRQTFVGKVMSLILICGLGWS